MDGELRDEGFGFLVGNGWVDDDIVTLLPVHRSGHAVLVADLERCVSQANQSNQIP